MNDKQLRTFIAVYEAGSMAKASEQIYITVPALKKQLDALESELNAVLFHRTSRGMYPTSAGKDFYRYACDAVFRLECELNSLRDIVHRQENLIRVGFNTRHIRDPFYFHAAAVFRKLYPSIDIKLVELKTYSPDLCDVFVGTCEENEYDLSSHLLCNMPVHCLLPITHPLASHSEITMEELRYYPLILPPVEITHMIQPDIISLLSLAPSIQYLNSSEHNMSYIAQAALTQSIVIMAGCEENIIAPIVQIPIQNCKIPYYIHVQKYAKRMLLQNYVKILQDYYQRKVPL